jgi:23S rRNA (pseudouridine1915-N3)-methyltransferase
MKLIVRAVGRMRDRRIDELCREYVERARRHLPIEISEVADDSDLLEKLPAGSEIIALEPGGKSWTTQAFCEHIGDRMNRGQRAIVFLIGAADGLPASVVAQAHLRLSLSPLTLPHRLARLLLCEQLYRVISRLRGEPYDR